MPLISLIQAKRVSGENLKLKKALIAHQFCRFKLIKCEKVLGWCRFTYFYSLVVLSYCYNCYNIIISSLTVLFKCMMKIIWFINFINLAQIDQSLSLSVDSVPPLHCRLIEKGAHSIRTIQDCNQKLKEMDIDVMGGSIIFRIGKYLIFIFSCKIHNVLYLIYLIAFPGTALYTK